MKSQFHPGAPFVTDRYPLGYARKRATVSCRVTATRLDRSGIRSGRGNSSELKILEDDTRWNGMPGNFLVNLCGIPGKLRIVVIDKIVSFLRNMAC